MPNEVVLDYEARGAARELFRARDGEILIEGPAGTGKTRGVLEKILKRADYYPGSRHLICRKTRASMTESVLVTFEEKVLPAGSPIAAGPHREQRRAYDLDNGSSIVVGGLDKPERLFSTEFDTIAVFEAIEATENDYESLHRALRNGKTRYHQIIADTNPGPLSHWLNQRANAGGMRRLLSRHEDNPQFYDAAKGDWTDAGREYIRVLDALTGHRKLRLRIGKWASAEGVVYETYDATIHLKARDELPAFSRYVAGVDWGFTNPGVVQVWGVDGDGRMYLVREVVRTKQTIDFWIEQAKALNAEYRPEVFVCDPAEPAYIMQFRSAKVPAVGGFNDIEAGINAVQQRFKAADDGRPRLYLSHGSLAERDENLTAAKLPDGLAEELDAYSWPKGKDGKPIKEVPADKDNHSCDAMRYACAYLDDLAGSKITLVGGGRPIIV